VKKKTWESKKIINNLEGKDMKDERNKQEKGGYDTLS
jgi:hypothetical protein